MSVGRAELDGPFKIRARQAGHGPVMKLNDESSIGKQSPTVAGGTQGVTVADQQWATDAIFESLHLATDRRLTHVESPSCVGHAAMV